MSGKVKVRCARCGKSFKSSGAKQTLCAECEARVRQERLANKTASAQAARPAPVPAPAPKIVGPGASILVPGLVSPATSVPPERGASDATTGTPLDGRGRAGHAPPSPPTQQGAPAPSGGQTLPQGGTAAREKAPRPARHEAPPPQTPREPKPPRAVTPPVELTDELRQRIEARYLELANPVEFDGIRTRIAGELSVPKALVKKAVAELRSRLQLPSWWELQSYTGGTSDLERIRRAYLPYLPVPDIGIHKTIATELELDPGVVYQGIKRIRAEMRLPRYNPPALHEAAPSAPSDDQATAETEAPVSTPGA